MDGLAQHHASRPKPLLKCSFQKQGDGWACGTCGRLAKCKAMPYAVCSVDREALRERYKEVLVPESATETTQAVAPSRVKRLSASGPGTELKKLLKKVGITASPTCSCNTRARTMDAKGVEWCEANIDTIVGWLREEATKRKLPFVDMAGRLLVRRAISNARRQSGQSPESA